MRNSEQAAASLTWLDLPLFQHFRVEVADRHLTPLLQMSNLLKWQQISAL